MVERVIERGHEPEPEETTSAYTFKWFRDRETQLREGTVVIRGKDIRWEQNRQSVIKPYLNPANWSKWGSPEWMMFCNHIKKQSGKHVHQGGLGIFVLQGRGYTVVDGERFDWVKMTSSYCLSGREAVNTSTLTWTQISRRYGWPLPSSPSAWPAATRPGKKSSPPPMMEWKSLWLSRHNM